MSYIQMLQQARQREDDGRAALMASLGNMAMGFADMKLKGDERAKTQAQEQVAFIQKRAGAMLQAGQGKQAAELLPQFREAVKTGYDVDLPNTSVVGAPITALPQGPVPLGAPAMAPVEIGRDFSGPQTLDTIRGGLMLEKPKAPERDLFKASPYENVIDTRTGQVIIPAQSKPAPEAAPRMGWVGDVYQELKPGVTRPAREAAPRAQRDNGAAMRQWQTGRIKYIEDQIERARKQTPLITEVPDPEGSGTIDLKIPVHRPLPADQEAAIRARAGKFWDENVTRPFEQPGSGQAAPAVRGVRSSAILPPKDYNDTGLLPEWEKLAQQAVSLAPGAAISSKARSKERNANAGGVAGSWHQYRQAFDLAGVKPTDKPKLIQWGRQQGLEVIDEGDHLHFEPARNSSADPKLRDFYARHGIEDADNA